MAQLFLKHFTSLIIKGFLYHQCMGSSKKTGIAVFYYIGYGHICTNISKGPDNKTDIVKPTYLFLNRYIGSTISVIGPSTKNLFLAINQYCRTNMSNYKWIYRCYGYFGHRTRYRYTYFGTNKVEPIFQL
jgi:hypothetical protein